MPNPLDWTHTSAKLPRLARSATSPSSNRHVTRPCPAKPRASERPTMPPPTTAASYGTFLPMRRRLRRTRGQIKVEVRLMLFGNLIGLETAVASRDQVAHRIAGERARRLNKAQLHADWGFQQLGHPTTGDMYNCRRFIDDSDTDSFKDQRGNRCGQMRGRHCARFDTATGEGSRELGAKR